MRWLVWNSSELLLLLALCAEQALQDDDQGVYQLDAGAAERRRGYVRHMPRAVQRSATTQPCTELSAQTDTQENEWHFFHTTPPRSEMEGATYVEFKMENMAAEARPLRLLERDISLGCAKALYSPSTFGIPLELLIEPRNRPYRQRTGSTQ